jgi:hypothetical protein
MAEKKPAPTKKPAHDNRASQFSRLHGADWKSRGQSRPAPSTGNKGQGS